MNLYKLKEVLAKEEEIQKNRVKTSEGFDTVRDIVHLPVEFKITRYASDEDFKANKPYSVTRDGSVNFDRGLVLNAGGNLIWNLVAGREGTTYSSTNARLVVGSDTTAAAATQTNVITALTPVTGVAQDAGWPVFSGGSGVTDRQIQYKSSFGSTAGNGAWQEFSVLNDVSTPTAMDRFVSNQGTKVLGQTWVLEITITLT